MNETVDAIYENGVFVPLSPVRCATRQRVTVVIPEIASDATTFALPPDRWAAFCDALDAPPKVIPALHNLLMSPGVFYGPVAAHNHIIADNRL